MSISDILLQALQEISDSVVLMGVEDGPTFRYHAANAAALTVGGVSMDYYGKLIEEVHPRAYAATLCENYHKAIRTKQPVEFYDEPSNSRQVSNHVVATPIFADHVCTHVVVVARNVSEQRRLEQELIVTEHKYNSLIYHNPDAVIHLAIDGAVTHLNPAAEALLGYTKAQLRDRRLLELMPESERRKHVQKFQEAMDREAVTFETFLTGKGGRKELIVKFVPDVDESGVIGIFAIAQDMSEKIHLESELRASELQYRLITDHVMDLILLLDPKGTVQYASPSHKRVLGIAPHWYIGKPSNVIVHAADNERVRLAVRETASTKELHTIEYRKRKRAKDEYIWVETTFVPVVDTDQHVTHIIAVSHDISQRRAYEEKLHDLAFTDPLTGLPNRRQFMSRIEEQLLSHGAEAFAVLFLDGDDFKLINDAFGHDTGDHVIIEMARRVQVGVRQTDLVSRIAGDEFCMLLPGAGQDIAVAIAERIETQLAAAWIIDGHQFTLGASIGIACYPQDGQTARQLMQAADQAMYRAKQQRKSVHG